MLHPEDDFGLLAFDTDYSWVVPLESSARARQGAADKVTAGERRTTLPRATAAALRSSKTLSAIFGI